jgi:hypothetical protein
VSSPKIMVGLVMDDCTAVVAISNLASDGACFVLVDSIIVLLRMWIHAINL